MYLVSAYSWDKEGLKSFLSYPIESAFKIFLPDQNCDVLAGPHEEAGTASAHFYLPT